MKIGHNIFPQKHKTEDVKPMQNNDDKPLPFLKHGRRYIIKAALDYDDANGLYDYCHNRGIKYTQLLRDITKMYRQSVGG